MKYLLLLLVLFHASNTFSQMDEQQLDSLRNDYLQKQDELRKQDEAISIQRAKIDSVLQKVEVELQKVAYLQAQKDSIARLKATMQKYIRAIDSLNLVNEGLMRDLLALPRFYALNTATLHIDHVQFLGETGEYAMSLVFLPEADQMAWYESAETGQHEVIYSVDPDYIRYRIPEEEINQSFFTDRFSAVHLYDHNNHFVGRGIFQGYEYLSQNIEPKTVAVFRTEHPSKDTAFYAVAGLADTLPSRAPMRAVNNTVFQDLQARIWPLDYALYQSSELEIDGFHWMVFQGLPTEPDYEKKTREQVRADLYLEHDGEIMRVHQLKDGWLYWHLQPLGITYNDFPIILLMKAMTESDWFQSCILIWNGEAYEERSLRFDVGE